MLKYCLGMKSFLFKLKLLFKPIDLTVGKIYSSILIFMLPILFSYIFQQIYTLADAIIVGQTLSTTEVNGVNATNSLTFIILQFAYGATAGFSVLSSKAIGKYDYKGVRKSFFIQFILSITIAIILTIISLSLLNPLLSLVGLYEVGGGNTYKSAYTYLFIIFLGIIAQVMYNQIVSLLRSIGDSLTPLLFLIASTILNIGLDLLFIITFKMGVAGAAIATVLAQLLAAIACYIYTFKKYKYLRFKAEDFKIGFKEYFEHLKLGLPLAFQFSILAIGLITLQGTIIKFDTTSEGIVLDNGPAQLTYGALSKIKNFAMTPFNALGTAMLSFCGQNKGANKTKRIYKGIKQALLIMIIMYVIIMIIMGLLMIDDFYLKIFYSSSMISEEVSYLSKIMSFCSFPLFFILGILFILRNSIQGIGKSLWPFLAGIGELIARTIVCLYGPYLFTSSIDTSLNLFDNPLPFIVVSFADPAAWLFAIIVLIAGYILYIYKPYKKLINEEKQVKVER